jgi:hypothetical protein
MTMWAITIPLKRLTREVVVPAGTVGRIGWSLGVAWTGAQQETALIQLTIPR